jgi:hypothetical protein
MTPVPSGRCPFEYEHEVEPQPLQYHYVVWAEIVDGKTVWRIDIEGDNLLHDGSVYDPNAKRGEEWRRLFDDEIYGLDSRLFMDLCDRLDVK